VGERERKREREYTDARVCVQINTVKEKKRGKDMKK